MDVALGVAVTDRVARLALVDSAAPGTVIDQFVLDVAEHPVEVLTETVVGTDRSLAGENHRLVATRLCWPDQAKADELQHALQDSGVHDVAVISEAQAATALVGAAHAGSAVLLVGDETATLSVVGDPDAPPTMVAVAPVAGADATSTVDTLMARLGDQALAPGDVFLVGRSAEHTTVLADQLRAASTMRVQTPDDPTFALARGAAMAAGAATMAHPALVADATTSLPPAEAGQSGSEGEQLAYSQASDYELLPVDEYEEHDEYGAAADRSAPLSRRSLLIGNAVVAFAVIGFASLAVAVAVTIRPTAASKPVDTKTPSQGSSCRCCRRNSRRRSRRLRPMIPPLDSRAAPFRLYRTWCRGRVPHPGWVGRRLRLRRKRRPCPVLCLPRCQSRSRSSFPRSRVGSLECRPSPPHRRRRR